ncbi:unnamed protein product [Phytomonas sp. EM1]|nr:unnamed protein product [Phytomonas sp. EM1]|eukprot:CCW61631.1 unnamed protein product [Phytomonas sp. isolate EM1]
MLHRDATATAPRRQIYQDVLEVLLPAFVAANLQLALMVLCALQSTMRGVKGVKAVELLGLWRTRVLAELDHGERRAMTEATLDFFYGMDDFCRQTTSAVSRMGLVRWIRSYCSGSGGGRTRGGAIMKDPLAHPSSSPTSSTELGSPAGASIYADLPFPILNPFKPWIVLRSVLLTSVRAESLSSSKPVWITFSSANDAQRRSRKGGQKESPSPPSAHEEKFYSFLYKRESAMRDQLMCISSRLLQWLLRNEIGDRVEIGNYSVLPLSDRSALIEHLEGYALSKLPGVANGNLALVTYLAQRGEAAQVNFLASAKLFLLLNYIFSIGDRHQGNVMMSPVGAILHIDFGYIFSEKTLVEKIAGTTMRVDSQLLSAVAFCRRAAAMAMTTASSDLPNDPSLDSSVGSDNNSLVMDNEGFFKEAAEWFLQVRPHAALFYELWRYAVRCQTLPFDERNLATIFNTLFDRSVSRESSADNFLRIMEHSINVCRLKDVTHSSVQAFRSYTDYVTRCVSETPSGVKRFFEYVWSHLNLSSIS